MILFNKPYGVICQFSADAMHPTLKQYISIAGVYAAGRLDTDSEGLVILTADGALQHRITDPKHKFPKTYWVQVEGRPDDAALQALAHGVDLGDFATGEVTRHEGFTRRTTPAPDAPPGVLHRTAWIGA